MHHVLSAALDLGHCEYGHKARGSSRISDRVERVSIDERILANYLGSLGSRFHNTSLRSLLSVTVFEPLTRIQHKFIGNLLIVTEKSHSLEFIRVLILNLIKLHNFNISSAAVAPWHNRTSGRHQNCRCTE